MNRLFVFGLGYSASAIGALLASKGWTIAGTVRSRADRGNTRSSFSAVLFDDSGGVEAELNRATHLLVSVPPNETGDPAWQHYAGMIQQAEGLRWLGYLSTIGVYGDQGGAWVDESTAISPDVSRGHARADAENIWARFSELSGIPLDIFRLAGIYGPGRNPLERVRDRQARRILKPGQVFNRIHIEDIAQTVVAAIEQEPKERAIRIFNVTDDEPAPPQDVLSYAARLLGVAEPPAIPFEAAALSPMARSFYEGNRRVRNAKIKEELGVRLKYPTYREGFAALAKNVS